MTDSVIFLIIHLTRKGHMEAVLDRVSAATVQRAPGLSSDASVAELPCTAACECARLMAVDRALRMASTPTSAMLEVGVLSQVLSRYRWAKRLPMGKMLPGPAPRLQRDFSAATWSPSTAPPCPPPRLCEHLSRMRRQSSDKRLRSLQPTRSRSPINSSSCSRCRLVYVNF
jgi:hypothetical protein